MKKGLMIFISILTVSAFAGCGDDTSGASSTQSQTTAAVTTAAVTTAAETTAASARSTTEEKPAAVDKNSDTCVICGGKLVCVICGKSGLYCENASYDVGSDHYCSKHWADCVEWHEGRK